MKIQFMKDASVTILKKNINTIIDNYKSNDSAWISDITKTDDNFGMLNKEFPDFDLIISDNPEKDDLENMKIIYSNLKDLSDSQASDERLWAGLAHTKFWNYMQKRWPIPDNNKNENFILQHYFFNNGAARSLLLNGLARLWWYARLSYDETNLDNPFELTDYIGQDINGKSYFFYGSNFTNNRRIQRIFLYTIKEFEEANNLVLTRDEFGEMRKKVVLWCGKFLVDDIPDNDFKEMLLKELNTMKKTN